MNGLEKYNRSKQKYHREKRRGRNSFREKHKAPSKLSNKSPLATEPRNPVSHGRNIRCREERIQSYIKFEVRNTESATNRPDTKGSEAAV